VTAYPLPRCYVRVFFFFQNYDNNFIKLNWFTRFLNIHRSCWIRTSVSQGWMAKLFSQLQTIHVRKFTLFTLLTATLCHCLAAGSFVGSRDLFSASGSRRAPAVYTNDFIVQLKPSSTPKQTRAHADWLASRHGFENHGTVSFVSISNEFLFMHSIFTRSRLKITHV